jgi:peptide/nickel transport system substrate-binding protein
MLISKSRHWSTGGAVKRPIWAVMIGFVVAGLAIAACDGSSAHSTSAATTASGKQGGTLTFGIPSGPSTMDAAKDSSYDTYSLMRFLSNEPLLEVNPNTGAIGPGLATSYSYVGKNNLAFELTIGQGNRFSDGTTVTAAAVKAWLEYFTKADGPFSAFLPIKSIVTPTKWTVEMTFSAPTANVPFYLSGINNIGFVTGPKGLADPSSLATSTDGAGPYEYDASESVTNNHYTFVPNPYYSDQSAIKWKKIVVKVITTPSSMLEAMQSGQVDVAIGDPSTAAAAQSDGLSVKYAPQGWDGITWTDRNGTKFKPLGSALVRQALNYAINRKAITEALLGKFGVPTDQWTTTDGFSQAYNNYYSYNPTKAKQLLARAGYPNGFTLPVVDQGDIGNLGDPLVQAVAQELKAVGVTLQITTDSTTTSWLQAAEGTSYAGFGNAWGTSAMSNFYDLMFAPKGVLNQFNVVDPVINQWEAEAAEAPPVQAASLAQKISIRMVTQGDILAVTEYPTLVYAQKNIAGVSVTPWFLFLGAATQWSQG